MKKIGFIALLTYAVFYIVMLIIDSSQQEVIGVKQILGKWHHKSNQVLVGSKTSDSYILNITKTNSGKDWSDYQYELKRDTFVDGRQTINRLDTGDFRNGVNEYGLTFYDKGKFGLNNGYIVIPSDNWINSPPDSLVIKFLGYGEGIPQDLIFKRHIAEHH